MPGAGNKSRGFRNCVRVYDRKFRYEQAVNADAFIRFNLCIGRILYGNQTVSRGLPEKGGGVRSIDIATRLGVSKPSVSHAMKLLREDGYIAMDRYGTVTLLEKGAEIANQIYERHTVLAKMLEGLGVPAEIALEDACKMEHDISQESFEKIKAHYNNFIKKEEAAAE